MEETKYTMGSKRSSICGVVGTSSHHDSPCLPLPISPSAQILGEYQQYMSSVSLRRPSYGSFTTVELEPDPHPYAALPPMLKLEPPSPLPSLATYVPAVPYCNQQQRTEYIAGELSSGLRSQQYSVPSVSEPPPHLRHAPTVSYTPTTSYHDSPSAQTTTTTTTTAAAAAHDRFVGRATATDENLHPDDTRRQTSSDTMMTMDDASQTTISVRGSVSMSATSDDVEESRYRHICAAVRAIHDVCLQSTQTYLQTHRANRLARSAAGGGDEHQHQHQHSSPNHPDHTYYPHHFHHHHNPTTTTTLTSDNNGAGGTGIPNPTTSLLQNVSSICTMLWAGAQRDRLDVLDVERLAVENMSSLLAWAETVALGDCDEWRRSFSSSTTTSSSTITPTTMAGMGMTTGGGRGGGGGGEGLSAHDQTVGIDGDATGVGAGLAAAAEEKDQQDTALWRVFEAGSNLCAWLGIADGVEAMAVLEGDIWGRGGIGG